MGSITAALKNYTFQGDSIELLVEVKHPELPQKFITYKARDKGQLESGHTVYYVLNRVANMESCINAGKELKAFEGQYLAEVNLFGVNAKSKLEKVVFDYESVLAKVSFESLVNFSKDYVFNNFEVSLIDSLRAVSETEVNRIAYLFSFNGILDSLIDVNLIDWATQVQEVGPEQKVNAESLPVDISQKSR